MTVNSKDDAGEEDTEDRDDDAGNYFPSKYVIEAEARAKILDYWNDANKLLDRL